MWGPGQTATHEAASCRGGLAVGAYQAIKCLVEGSWKWLKKKMNRIKGYKNAVTSSKRNRIYAGSLKDSTDANSGIGH